MSKTDLISIEKIEKAIYLIRGEKVMLDRDLAELYHVQTKALNQAVRRNPDRFSADFMFQLSEKEVVELGRSQFVTGSEKHRDPRSSPHASPKPRSGRRPIRSRSQVVTLKKTRGKPHNLMPRGVYSAWVYVH